jgi:hypothetical protein
MLPSDPRQTASGRRGRAREREEKIQACRRSNACRPARCLHSGQCSAREDGGTHAHNTLSVDNTDVQVLYPFHPLHGVPLRVLRRPERGDGAVCVVDPAGRRLKIPTWMMLPECAETTISQRPHLSKQVLLSLASLITSQLDSKDPAHDNLRQTRGSGRQGGRGGATSTSGSDDPKRMRCRANGRSDARRSDRSDGPRSSSGLSRGGKKRK